MAMEYTEEQLNNFDKATLVQMFLVQQSQLRDIDQKLQLLLEQVAVLNNNRLNILVRQSRLSGFIRATVPVIGSHQKCYAAKGSLHE